MKRDRKEALDQREVFDIFRRVFDSEFVCGRQDLGSDSATDTLKTGRAIFASVDGV